MKSIFSLIFVILILPLALAETTCTDSDGGPLDPAEPKQYLAVPSDTSTKSLTLSDYCSEEKQGKKKTEGPWIKEYTCVGTLVIGKDYLCKDYGYDKCISEGNKSACVLAGQTKLSQPQTTTIQDKTQTGQQTLPKKPKIPEKPRCGDKRINVEKEQCDPPGKICLLEGQPGTCQKDCTCQLYTGGKQSLTPEETAQTTESTNTPEPEPQTQTEQPPAPNQQQTKQPQQQSPPRSPILSCGDKVIQAGEECEKNTDCTPPQTCQQCACTSAQSDSLFRKLWRWLNGIFS